MKMKAIKYIAVLLLAIYAGSCVDNNENDPPVRDFTTGTIATIQQVKDLYAAELAKVWTDRVPVQITEDWTLKGLVTASDKKDGNLYKEAYIQDATGGLRLTFNSTSGLYTGDSVVVNMKGLYLSDYGNLIQVGGQPYKDASGSYRLKGLYMDEIIKKVSINNPTVPILVTIPQLKSIANLGKLVRIENVQFTDGEIGKPFADYNLDPPASANRTLMDCSKNQVIVRTSGYASFASDTINDLNGSIIGIVTVFNSDYQLVIRDFNEVQFTNERCTPDIPPLGAPVETINQNFNSFGNNVDLNIPGWQNIPQYGDRVWRNVVFSGNGYAQSTGFNSNLTKMVSWLITQPVTISTQKVLSFQTAKAYWAHTGTNLPLQVFYSTNYTGKNLVTATWVPVNLTMAQKTDADHTFINSGTFNLPVEAGKSCVIAFRYTGSNTESTSYRVDNILITTAK
ncbi:MAG: DUF5689 domain-containing protein [Bacteroidales bacterium]